jgi:hypothetical protein
MLSVGDQFAGKTGRCPNCGALMPIPETQPDIAPAPDEPLTAIVASEPVPAPPTRGRSREGDEANDESPRRRFQADDDPPYVGKKRSGGPPAAVIAILALGTGLLVFLALTPLFGMFMPSKGRSGPPGGFGAMIELTEGKVLLIGTLVVAGVCLAALVVYLLAPPRVSHLVVTLTNCLAAAWGVTVLIWQLGFIWDISRVLHWMKEFQGQPEPGFLPGLALWIGLGASLAVVILFAVLASLRGKGLWLYPAEGLGVLAGILLLVLNVQPWKPGPTLEDLRGVATVNERAALNSESKLESRYGKLLRGR